MNADLEWLLGDAASYMKEWKRGKPKLGWACSGAVPAMED